MVKIAVSILSANMDKLDEEILEVTYGGADFIHIDVMDGFFVDNKTDGEFMMETALKNTMLPLDVHLMVSNPLECLEKYIGADRITFHVEAISENDFEKIVNRLHELNIKVGISIKPNTSIDEIEKYIDKVDMVLVMTVEPGYGGQKLISETLKKVKALREKYPSLDIEVDGGINEETSRDAIDAGANILVAGSAIFKNENREDAIKVLI